MLNIQKVAGKIKENEKMREEEGERQRENGTDFYFVETKKAQHQ